MQATCGAGADGHGQRNLTVAGGLRIESEHAGLLLLLPGVVELGYQPAVKAAGYPSTRTLSSWHSMASLLVCKLARHRRIHHVEDLAADPAAGLAVGLNSLPTCRATRSSEEVSAYLAHHFRLAGRSDPLFADDAQAAIAQASRGLPRQVGNLATAALIAGYAKRNRIVDHDSALAAISDAQAD